MAGTPGQEGERDPVGDLGDAWRWGFDTSRLMGERLLDLYGEVGAATLNQLARDGGDDVRRIRMDMERWVDLSVELFDRAFTVMRRLGDNGQNGTGPSDAVSLAGSPGSRGTGELWVHNVSDAERTAPALRCSGLTSAVCGGEIAASLVRLEAGSDPLAGRTSRRVSVAVDIPASTVPGTYHGLILSDASPESAIPLRLQVQGG